MYGFAAVDLLYVIAFMLVFTHYHAGTRQRMMIMKTVACCLTATYFHLLGADTAMLAAMIAGLSGLSQAFFSDETLHKTTGFRTALAVVMCGASIAVCAGNSLEALPLIAVINSRLVEIQACKQRIRIGYILSNLCWIFYAFSSGLVLIYIAENLGILSNLSAIWKEERRRKKSVPIPVRAA